MNILVVDDEERISDFIVKLAQREGYTDVDTVPTATEAVTQVMRREYDLITVDLKMPDASGLEIIGTLRNMCPHAIIVVISGFLPEAVSAEVASCVDLMMAKPVRVDALVRLFKAADQIDQILDEIQSLGSEESDV